MTDGRRKGSTAYAKKSLPRPRYVEPRHSSAYDEDDEEEDGPTLESQFAAFATQKGDEEPQELILLSQIDAWMRQAGVIQVRKLTRTDTGVCYFHFRKYKLNFEEFNEFLHLLAHRKRIPVEEIIEKLINCGHPPREEEMIPMVGGHRATAMNQP